MSTYARRPASQPASKHPADRRQELIGSCLPLLWFAPRLRYRLPLCMTLLMGPGCLRTSPYSVDHSPTHCPGKVAQVTGEASCSRRSIRARRCERLLTRSAVLYVTELRDCHGPARLRVSDRSTIVGRCARLAAAEIHRMSHFAWTRHDSQPLRRTPADRPTRVRRPPFSVRL